MLDPVYRVARQSRCQCLLYCHLAVTGKAFDKPADKPKLGIMHKGLPYRAEEYSAPRFDGVGEDKPKASDHCPVFVDIPFPVLT
ncbi:MAG: hypothetical protein U1F76_22255 [Candidatus Competibacteraceae bacterium]